MKTIMGLMLKDLYVFKSYKKNIIFSIIVFTFMIGISSLNNNVIAMGSILFLIVFGMNSISTFSYDEMSDANRYLLYLPIKRSELILAKYLFSFLNSLVSFIIGFLLSIIITLIFTGHIPALGDAFKLSLLVLTSITFLMCTDIPCIYKWGVEKGRMQAVVVPVIIFFILGIISFIFILLFPEILLLINLKTLWNFVPLLAITLIIILYLISYTVSYYIFIKKDL